MASVKGFNSILTIDLEETWDLRKMASEYDDIVSRNNISQVCFSNQKISAACQDKLSSFFNEIIALGISEFCLSGGLAVALAKLELTNFDLSAFTSEVVNKFTDIDVYVDKKTFAKLKKNKIFEKYSKNIIQTEFFFQLFNKRKLQIINIDDLSNMTKYVSAFDINICRFFFHINFIKAFQVLYYDSKVVNFDKISIEYITKNSVNSSFSRAQKYMERYPSISKIEITPTIFSEALEQHNLLIGNQSTKKQKVDKKNPLVGALSIADEDEKDK